MIVRSTVTNLVFFIKDTSNSLLETYRNHYHVRIEQQRLDFLIRCMKSNGHLLLSISTRDLFIHVEGNRIGDVNRIGFLAYLM